MFSTKPKPPLTDAELLQKLKNGEAHTGVTTAALARILEKLIRIEEALKK